MTDVFDAVRSRRSVRDFKGEDVPDLVVGKLMEAFKWAPTAGNIQHLVAVVVQKPKLLKEVVNSCVDQKWAHSAPVIIVVCSNTPAVEKVFGNKGREYALQGTASASQNILLVAEELGLASCWIGAFSESRIKKILKMPQSIEIHNLIAVGYPLRKTKAPTKLPTHKVVKFDGWASYVKGHDKVFAFWEPTGKLLLDRAKKKVGLAKKKAKRKIRK